MKLFSFPFTKDASVDALFCMNFEVLKTAPRDFMSSLVVASLTGDQSRRRPPNVMVVILPIRTSEGIGPFTPLFS